MKPESALTRHLHCLVPDVADLRRIRGFLSAIIVFATPMVAVAGGPDSGISAVKEQVQKFEDYVEARNLSRVAEPKPGHSPYEASQRDFAAAVAQAYEEMVRPYLQAESLTAEHENALIDSTFTAVFYATNAGLDMEHDVALVEVLERAVLGDRATSEPDEEHLKFLYRAYVKNRLFEEANSLVESHSRLDLEPIEFVRESEAPDYHSETPRFWVWNETIGTLELRRADDLLSGKSVLLLARPGCQFTRRALAEIAQSRDLGERFQEHGYRIVPPSGQLLASGVAEMAAQFRPMPVGLIHRREAWPFITEDRSSPTFYFLADGKVEYAVFGWQGPESIEELRSGFRKIGFHVEQRVDAGD